MLYYNNTGRIATKQMRLPPALAAIVAFKFMFAITIHGTSYYSSKKSLT
jgi:hypothetical protein